MDELCQLSPEFEALRRDNDVRSYGEGVEHLRQPILGPITFEYSSFTVNGRSDLGMLIYNAATPLGAERIRSPVMSQACPST